MAEDKGDTVVTHHDLAPAGTHVSDQFHEHDITDASQMPQPASSKRWMAIGSLIFLYNISLGGFLCVVPIIQYMNRDLGPDPSYTWLASSWTVASGVGLIVAGSLSDLIGRRWFCISTGLLGILAALIGALAQDVPTAIGAMAVMGLNGGLAVNSFVAVAELVATKHRGYVIGVMNGSAIFWVSCGSLIGHEMTVKTKPGWRSIFWMILAVNVVGTVFTFLTYFPAPALGGRNLSKRKLIKDFDYFGLLGIVVGPTMFLMGIIWIPEHGSTSGEFVGPFVAGTVILVALGLYENYGAKNPLLHPFLFKRIRTFTMLLVTAFVGGMLFYSLQAFFPTYLSTVYDGTDGRQVGIDGIPFGIGTQVGGVGSAILLPIIGPKIGTMWMVAFGVLLQVLFIPLMCLPGLNTKGMALAFSCLGGIGIGIIELLTILLIQLATPDEWIGFANGAIGLLRCMGGSVGTAIYTTIFQSKASQLIPRDVAAVAIQAGLPQSSLLEFLGVLTGAITTTPISAVPGVTPGIIEISSLALRRAYMDSFKYVWYASIPFGVVSLACALSTKDLSPNLTMKVAQHIKSELSIEDAEGQGVPSEANTTVPIHVKPEHVASRARRSS
ncbi:uncharacterized protein Z518_04677 [Rhinocladiella mackenziei CBS 650.93]|uniref:Major facilitator superfamily (MFS) profile domain-containing protein n=1 Tax=Rhinocladiella mackenziei CBS 650.93 TaxID=1442369 RepID=A0A0D2IU60_9EURO|nr:uncharacterized protein Z518_04677 [Rhinocladiella mackenziei CBS 650.93]KIX06701.1 hypothetical protein Z518_04677 [Rhinocladiella mackenziei CBS 650.93]